MLCYVVEVQRSWTMVTIVYTRQSRGAFMYVMYMYIMYVKLDHTGQGRERSWNSKNLKEVIKKIKKNRTTSLKLVRRPSSCLARNNTFTSRWRKWCKNLFQMRENIGFRRSQMLQTMVSQSKVKLYHSVLCKSKTKVNLFASFFSWTL